MTVRPLWNDRNGIPIGKFQIGMCHCGTRDGKDLLKSRVRALPSLVERFVAAAVTPAHPRSTRRRVAESEVMVATGGSGPIVPRRRIAAELRRLREERGLTLDQVAGSVLISTSKLSRLENAQGSPQLRDVRDLIREYGLADTPLANELTPWTHGAPECAGTAAITCRARDWSTPSRGRARPGRPQSRV